MKFTRRLFLIAGIYGIIVILPMYFYESNIAINYPPAITHPEYFYGFIGVTLAWQFLFLLLAKDPLRYRIFMLPAVFEKFSYSVAIILLFFQNRVTVMILVCGIIDLLFGILFLAAYFMIKNKAVV